MALSSELLAEIEKRFDRITLDREKERRERVEPVAMGSYAADQPYLHFLHASEEEQLRVAREVLGLDPGEWA